ncbi:hypothetical protein OQA87_07665 [Yersinia intermedia]|uniref:hypothetical protein n=1 Tax=Yersinia intermedia TaxID=631 RepID=UPI00067E00E7|nr:hypothetical protein [Yersinia intermedia]MCW8111470.1 hypothetical protein [Yersinia intermedia]OWF92295.1 hypothetical protein B4916_04965 [Yersinia intermedia]
MSLKKQNQLAFLLTAQEIARLHTKAHHNGAPYEGIVAQQILSVTKSRKSGAIQLRGEAIWIYEFGRKNMKKNPD